jgi:hypothetical protein
LRAGGWIHAMEFDHESKVYKLVVTDSTICVQLYYICILLNFFFTSDFYVRPRINQTSCHPSLFGRHSDTAKTTISLAAYLESDFLI